ncbi:MAG: hypothetical protein V1492_01935 [Candidatus Micrarchaeota archaeon]
MNTLAQRFIKGHLPPRPPLSERRSVLQIPGRMNNVFFERFYVDTVGKAEVRFPPTEGSLVKLGAVAHNIFRSTASVEIETFDERNTKTMVPLPVWNVLLNRLWADDLCFFWRMGEPHDVMKNYIGRGGNLTRRGCVDPVCTLNFLERPDVAREHISSFKQFLNSVPHDSETAEQLAFPIYRDFDFSGPRMLIRRYLSELKTHSAFRFQSHITGVPVLEPRYVGKTTIKKYAETLAVVISRLFPWDSNFIEKLYYANLRRVPVAKPIAVLTIDSIDFLVMTDEGKDLFSVTRDNADKPAILPLYQQYGKLIYIMHWRGVGHDDPAPRNVVVKILGNQYPELRLIDYEDLWLQPTLDPIPHSERKLGMMRIMQEIHNGHLPNECLDAFIDGYGKDEFKKVMG